MHLPSFPLGGILQGNFFTMPFYFNICSLLSRSLSVRLVAESEAAAFAESFAGFYSLF